MVRVGAAEIEEEEEEMDVDLPSNDRKRPADEVRLHPARLTTA